MSSGRDLAQQTERLGYAQALISAFRERQQSSSKGYVNQPQSGILNAPALANASWNIMKIA